YRAAAAASVLVARAYTAGADIVFGRDQLAPRAPRGAWLLAHELAHVVQHSQGRGSDRVHRQPEAVPELDRRLHEAVAAKDWKLAAEILNSFSPDDIR